MHATNHYATKEVWLIDDDEAINFISKRLLTETLPEVQVNAFNSAQEACLYLEKAMSGLGNLPDLIFLDINMPMLNGWDFVDHLNKLALQYTNGELPHLVMLTASMNAEDHERASNHDTVSYYCRKPLKREHLEEINHFLYKGTLDMKPSNAY